MYAGRVLPLVVFACLWTAGPASAQIVPEQACDRTPAAFCTGSDKLTERGLAECRRAELCPGIRDQVDMYEDSYTHMILDFQYDLGRDVGFANAQWVGTHNSFNSPSEETTLSSTDSNQQYSLTDQLRMDVRSLEIDLHWFRGTTVVCHGLPGSELNAGCTTERELPVVIDELNAWLDANPDQVLMIYLEDDTSSNDGRADAATKLNRGFEDRLYRPASGGCRQLPSDLTRNDVLDTGAQVFLVSGCGSGAGWNDTVFDWNAMHDETGGSTGFSACERDFSRDEYDTKLIRYFEDSTWLSATISPGGPPRSQRGITPAVAGKMIRCGVDLLGMDQLEPFDGRLGELAWSWAVERMPEPGDCAIQRGSDGRWTPTDCAIPRPAACHDPSDGSWDVSAPVAFADAGAACATLGRNVSVPRTGWENELLETAAAGSDVYLGLTGTVDDWSTTDQR